MRQMKIQLLIKKFKNVVFIIFVILLITNCNEQNKVKKNIIPTPIKSVKNIPMKKNIWVFIMAGQSNMAGRGLVEPKDTLVSERVLTINIKGEIILAKEPIHFYEPSKKGLDCGLSFGKNLIKHIPDSISVLLIPTAVGDTSVSQWLNNTTHQNIELLSNFKEKADLGKNYGHVKAILWHQGESDAVEKKIIAYKENLKNLFEKFRTIVGNPDLPILMAELGSYSSNEKNWQLINNKIEEIAESDINIESFSTFDLKDRGDKVHFNSEGQRIIGKRFANTYINFIKNTNHNK